MKLQNTLKMKSPSFDVIPLSYHSDEEIDQIWKSMETLTKK